MVNPFLSFQRGSSRREKIPQELTRIKERARHTLEREQCNPSGSDPRMFAIGRRPPPLSLSVTKGS